MTNTNIVSRKVVGNGSAKLAKAQIVKAADVPKVSPKAKAVKVDANQVKLDALADMIRGLNNRIDAYETQVAILMGQCTALENVIIGLQTARVDTTPKAAPKAAPKAQDAKVKARAAKDAAIAFDSYGDAIEQAVDNVIDGINSGRFNEKIVLMVNHDLRVFCETALNKALKAYRTENGISLVTLSSDIIARFEMTTGQKASQFNPATK